MRRRAVRNGARNARRFDGSAAAAKSSAGLRIGWGDDPQWRSSQRDACRSSRYIGDLAQIELLPWCGEVTATVGLLIESQGPAVAIGDFCEILTRRRTPDPHAGDRVPQRPRAGDAAG